jgi:hypothetical protein
MENQVSVPVPQAPIAPQGQGDLPSGSKRSGAVKKIIILVILAVIAGGVYFAYRLLSTEDIEVLNQAGRPSPSQEALPSQETRVTEDFSGVEISIDRWHSWSTDPETGRIEQVNGRLEIDIPSTSGIYNAGAIDTRFEVKGDFEVVVDLAIVEGGIDSSETGLIFHDASENWPNRLSLLVKKEEGGTMLHAVSFVNGVQSYSGSRVYDNSGPFTVKISRLKGVATFSVLEEGGFEVIRTLTDFYTGDGFISLQANSFEPNYPGVFSTFDNFSLSPQ